MKNLQISFENYLEALGKIGEIPLGEQEDIKEHSNQFLTSLKQKKSFNSVIFISMFIVLFVLFGASIFLVIYHRDNPSLIGTIMGGTFLSIIAIVAKLRQLWFEKFIIDNASVVLQNFSPERAAEFILHLYQCFVSKSGHPKSKM